MNKRLLIIEDKTDELIYAQAEAAKLGYRDISHATNLDDALPLIPKAEHIVTDLFFPTEQFKEKYVNMFLPAYEEYEKQRFTKDGGNEVVRRAVMAWAELFGKTTLQEGLEMFEAHTHNYDARGNPNSILKAARDAVSGVRDYDRYVQFQEVMDGVKTGEELPLGIIVQNEAKQYDIPTVIVTSTYHHDDAFEAVRKDITAPYIDTLVDGRKDWKRGLERLMGRSEINPHKEISYD